MCTGIKIDYDHGCVMGRTMDFEVPINYNALYLPRNYNFSDDLMGNPMNSKYKSLGICFENKTPLKDGVNEHGLIGITNTFTGFNLYDNKVDTVKINISSLDYLTYALGNYKSHTNPTVYQLGFEEIEDDHKRQEFFLELDFVVQKLK